MTDRFCRRAVRGADGPGRVRAVSRYTADSRDRVRDAVDMVALVELEVELRRAGVNSYFGCCPFHDERTAVVPRQPRREALPLLRLLGVRRPVRLRDADRGARLQGRARVARRPLRRDARDRGGGPGGGGRARPARAALLAARRGRRPSTRATCGRRARRRGAREYLLGRGFTEETLREFRVGYAPAPWERIVRRSRSRPASATRSCSPPGWRSASRQRPDELIDRFRGRIMFPTADARGRVRGFGARAMGSDRRPEVPEHRRRRALPQARGALRDRARARGGREGGADGAGRGLHRRDRAAPGGSPQRRRDHGHLADPRAGRRARPRWSACSSCASTPTGPARRRWSGPRSCAPTRSSSCASCRCRRAPTPAI